MIGGSLQTDRARRIGTRGPAVMRNVYAGFHVERRPP